MNHSEFIQFHLDRVSRSFALAIRLLHRPLYDYVGASYLLFRILDTIEDAMWVSADDQAEAYRVFLSILEGDCSAASIQAFRDVMERATVIEAERALVADFQSLLALFQAFPERIQSLIHSKIATMAFGMKNFGSRGRLKLHSLQELDLYCYFVAGVVGELLTEFLDHEVGRLPEPLRNRAIPFGLFLQKVNILKDRKSDLSEGREFDIPRLTILKSLRLQADEAFGYLKALPRSRPDFVMFCALSYFLGLTAVTMVERDLNSLEPVKPTRDYTLHLLQDIQRTLSADGDFTELRQRIESQNPVSNEKS